MGLILQSCQPVTKITIFCKASFLKKGPGSTQVLELSGAILANIIIQVYTDNEVLIFCRKKRTAVFPLQAKQSGDQEEY